MHTYTYTYTNTRTHTDDFVRFICQTDSRQFNFITVTVTIHLRNTLPNAVINIIIGITIWWTVNNSVSNWRFGTSCLAQLSFESLIFNLFSVIHVRISAIHGTILSSFYLIVLQVYGGLFSYHLHRYDTDIQWYSSKGINRAYIKKSGSNMEHWGTPHTNSTNYVNTLSTLKARNLEKNKISFRALSLIHKWCFKISINMSWSAKSRRIRIEPRPLLRTISVQTFSNAVSVQSLYLLIESFP